MPSHAELGERPVLLLLLDPAESATQALFLGTARVLGADLEVSHAQSGSTIHVPRLSVERDGFAPTVLPRLVGSEHHLARARSLATQVDWCVPLLLPDRPPGAEEVPGFIAGLARGADGRVLLMQVR